MTDETGLDIASTIRPMPGQSVGGDDVVVRRGGQVVLAIIDVLGHGPEAHALTKTICDYLLNCESYDIARTLKGLHKHLQGTRGAAVGLCAIDGRSGRLDYAGIGNTVIRRFGSAETRLVSQDGVLGQNMRTPHQQSLQLEPGDLVLLYTEGVSDRFSTDDYPALDYHSVEEVSRNVVQRFGKSHDDAACVAVRMRP